MKKFICLFLIIIATSTTLSCKEIPHLILYFDINKTLIASDKAGNKSVEDVLNELLAEKYEVCWDTSLKQPLSFDLYVNKFLLPGSKDDLELRKQRKFYTQHFIQYLEEHNHPLYKEVLQEYQLAQKILNSSNGEVFPSFYLLLNELDRKGISYSIILRSFGEEVFDVKTEIDSVYKKMFNKMGEFRNGKLFLEEEVAIEDSYAIYNQLCLIGHAAIHDDWNNWNINGMSAKQGKPFYINREDQEILPIFFDDNIREDDTTKNIIAPLNAVTGELIPIEELIVSKQAVRVETLKAILNVNYYIKCVEEAIEILKKKESLS